MKAKYFILILLIFILLLNIKPSYSQDAGINFILAFPQGEFKENVDRLGFGIDGEFYVPYAETRIARRYRDKPRLY